MKKKATYYADLLGNVYSENGKLKMTRNSQGYHYFSPNSKKISTHRFVWKYFNGNIPNGLEINHKNGIKTDNRLENLELVTRAQNLRHARELGLLKNHSRGSGSKLSITDIELIRDLRGVVRQRSLAFAYDVTTSCISRIQTNKRWAA